MFAFFDFSMLFVYLFVFFYNLSPIQLIAICIFFQLDLQFTENHQNQIEV